MASRPPGPDELTVHAEAAHLLPSLKRELLALETTGLDPELIRQLKMVLADVETELALLEQ